jgi:hypothetical protein
MRRAVPWLVAALFGVLGAAHGVAIALDGRSGFATLPILIPVSLGYERAMRAERNQPSGTGGDDAMAVLAAIDGVQVDPASREALATRVAALRASEAHLLDLRNRKHALNTRLMNVGVEVARELSPEQWSAVVMQRDAIRAKVEDPVFARLLEKLR